ncbi:MAG TPA: MFS transporter [Chloroflexota bacterium]|nr:MFS transporter [Chloroflexota bacterium]
MRLSGTHYGYLVAAAIASGEGGVGVLMAPYLTALGYGAPLVGLFVALYAIAGLLSRWPGGHWYRPGRVRPLLAASLLLVSTANLLFAHVSDALALSALRLLGGLGFGLGTTVNLAQFIDTLPPQRSRERAMSLYTAALASGFMLGNLLAGGFSDRGGYAAGFLAVAVPPLLAVAATPLAREPASVRGGRADRKGLRALLAAVGEPLLLVVLIESFLLNFLFGLHYAYWALYFLGVGASLGHLGVIRGLFSGTQVAARAGSSGLFRRFGVRRVAVAAMTVQVLAIALIPATSSLLLLTALSVLYGAARGIGMVANALGLAEASDVSIVGRGAASGLFNGAADLGTLIGPVLAGLLVQAVGLNTMFVVAPLGVWGCYAIGLWLALRRRPAREAPRP